ncbi:MAG: hypothetical protein ACE5HQ_06960 [Gemmatimonadota bacterium]
MTRSRRARSPAGVRLLALAILGPVGLAACGGDLWTGRMGRKLAEMPVGIPAERLPAPGSEGAGLVARYCSSCHGIPSPARMSAQGWVSTTRRMFRRVEHMARMGGMMRMMRRGPRFEVPTADEQARILSYLQDHAMRAIDEESLAEAGPSARLFARTCARCHALPDPAQHTAGEWEAVVERMRRHMEEMGVDGIDDEQAASILDYLRRNAGERTSGP